MEQAQEMTGSGLAESPRHSRRKLPKTSRGSLGGASRQIYCLVAPCFEGRYEMPPEAWHGSEKYVKPWHPELARVGMRVLSQVISASLFERNWSAPWHIHTKISNRLDPATTENLVYVYSNSNLVASLSQLVMLTSSRCLLGSMKMFRFFIACLLLPGGPGQGLGRLGAEEQRRRVTHFGTRREAQVVAPRLCAPLPTLDCLSCIGGLA